MDTETMYNKKISIYFKTISKQENPFKSKDIAIFLMKTKDKISETSETCLVTEVFRKSDNAKHTGQRKGHKTSELNRGP